jgi:hypothetical protein
MVTCMAVFGMVTASSALAATEPAYVRDPQLEQTIGGGSFTGSTGGVTFKAGGSEIACVSSTLSGEFGEGVHATQTVRKVVETFKGCKALFGTAKLTCPETTVSAKLKGTLGVINKSEHVVGLELEGEAGGEHPVFVPFVCQTLPFTVKGQVIGRFEDEVLIQKTKLTLAFAVTGEKQAVQGFEGGPTGQHLTVNESSGEASLVSTDVLTAFKESGGASINVELVQ